MVNEDKGFKFVLTFLTAVGTIIYSIYYYFQISTLHESLFVHVMAFITILLIFSFFLITYILIRGFSILGYDENNQNKKPNSDDFATKLGIKLPNSDNFTTKLGIMLSNCDDFATKLGINLYLTVFLLWVTFSIAIVAVILAISVNLITIFFLLFLIGLYLSFKFKMVGYFIITFILFSVVFYFSYIPISTLFQGHVEIKLDNIYYKDSTPMIPVSIEITGRRSESTIYLYQKNSTDYLIEIDKFPLETNRKNASISGVNRILFGNAFSSGRYNIFIDTTDSNMTEGYYEFVYERPIMNGPYYSNQYLDKGFEYGKSFYLVNNGSSRAQNFTLLS